MKKSLSIILCTLLCSCGSRQADVAALYRKNMKNRFLTALTLPPRCCPPSRLASRQWSLGPDNFSEESPCQIPDSSCFFGIVTETLVATNGPIPTALEQKLTPDDIERLKRHYPKTLQRLENYKPLYMQDIINMTRAGVSDDTIIHEIHLTRSSFYLTPQNEQTLLQAGVSKRVINEMMDTAVPRH